MNDENNLLLTIENKMSKMSKGHKRIALYLLEHSEKVMYVTAAKLGDLVGVSESTVVRFASEIGFDGYPKLQQALAEFVRAKLTARQRMEVASDRIITGNKHILKAVMQSDDERIHNTMLQMDEKVFDCVVDEIIKAEKIYIVGRGSSSILANFLAYYLNFMMDGVKNINAVTSEVFEQIYNVNEKDVFIGLGFPRYSKVTVKAMAYAKNQRASVIAITDSLNAPLTKFSNYTLLAKSEMISFVDSLVAPMSVLNALLIAVSIKKKDTLLHSFEKLEKIWDEFEVYDSGTSKKED